MNFLSIFKNKAIRIPLLQRDYVQGSKESIISPFIDSLLNEKQVSDLTYIYGYTDEEDYFIPVDGQQRLTTLWLLYLYAASKNPNNIGKFCVKFTFLSREYANDFCERLKNKLQDVLSNVPANTSLDKIIRNQYWFIDSWYYNATVRNMLLTLKYIHRKCTDMNADDLWSKLSSEQCHITFSFLDIKKDYGLDDDVYIKMNGRGRPLSIFENLKSWMDEKINKCIKSGGEPWCKQWLKNIDNKWTQLFWENRNLTQKNPEEIDGEQLCCFCNLLILYWMKNTNVLKNRIEQIKNKDFYLYEELLRLFPAASEKDEPKNVMSYLFDSLQKSKIPSLVWIERLDLMPMDFLSFAYRSLNKLTELSSFINDKSFEWYIGGSANFNKKLYELAMCEGSYGRTLPLLYSVLLIETEDLDWAKDWLRICRNLILNTNIEKTELPRILFCLEQSYSKAAAKEAKIYSLLRSEDSLLKAFDSKQVEEEVKKALLPSSYRPQMEIMENTRFFSGRIRSLFSLLENCNVEMNLDDFIHTSKIMMEIFEGSDKGIRACYDGKDHLFRRALMCYSPHFYGFYKNKYWCFCNNMDEWRVFLNDNNNAYYQESLSHFIVNVCLPAIKGKTDDEIGNSVYGCMKKAIEAVDSDYEARLEREEPKGKFYLHFVHHPGVWDYMGTSKCVWQDNDDHGFGIILKTSNGNNSHKMELRTYCLYLDYCETSVNDDMKKDREGWNFGIYPKEGTCLYFDIKDQNTNRTIAIDVFHNKTKEDDYNINLFVRPNKEEENDINRYLEVNKKVFESIFVGLNLDVVVWPNGRYALTASLSRKNVILLLRNLLKMIKSKAITYNLTSTHKII